MFYWITLFVSRITAILTRVAKGTSAAVMLGWTKNNYRISTLSAFQDLPLKSNKR